MKSVNVKRIAAAAAGAAMLGAAFAGAVAVDPGLAGFQFFSNGNPNVVLVVGSKAQPADAVAAANVGAMIGNLAYQSGAAVEITGTDLLTCGGTVSGSATLTVETPGVNPALAYDIRTYVNDYLDSNSDTTRNTSSASPSVSNGTISGDSKLVTQDHTQVLTLPSTGKITNPKGLNVKEEQRVRLFSRTEFDTSDDRLESRSLQTLYQITFSDPLPLCWDTTKTQATCADKDLLTKSRTKITFLGEQWVIVPFSGKTWTLGTNGVAGAALGKEVDYQSFMVSGDSTTLPDGKKVVLADITGIGTGTSTQTRATFQIYAADGSLLDQTSLYPLESYDKNGVVIFVWDAVGGSIGGTDYAEVSLFANKLDLSDGQEISGQGDWKVDLVSTMSSSSEALQEIVLYDPITLNDLAAGDSVNMIKNLAGLKVTFNGLDLKDDDYDTMNFKVIQNQTLAINGSGAQLNADFLQITSAKSNAFQFESGAVNVDNVYVLLSGNGAYGTMANNLSQFGPGAIFYQGQDYFEYSSNSTELSPGATSNWTSTVAYYPSAQDTATIRVFRDGNTSGDLFFIAIPESTEDGETTSSVSMTGNSDPYWILQYDAALRQFVNSVGSTTIDKIGYEADNVTSGGLVGSNLNGTSAYSIANQEPKYVSGRGSVFVSVGASSATIKYAKKLGYAHYVVSKGSTTTTGNKVTSDFTAGEKALDDSGYMVTVDAIKAGGAGGAVGNVDQLGTSVETADDITPLDTSANPLVVLDTNPMATQSANVITFGGQIVNSVSASALAGAELTTSSEPVVKMVGTKLVVAGYDAAGTTAAANSLIAWLAQNRASLTQ